MLCVKYDAILNIRWSLVRYPLNQNINFMNLFMDDQLIFKLHKYIINT